jgi:hypothetical protein
MRRSRASSAGLATIADVSNLPASRFGSSILAELRLLSSPFAGARLSEQSDSAVDCKGVGQFSQKLVAEPHFKSAGTYAQCRWN